MANNLPVPLTSFVGREREIAEVRRLLRATRLFTLTGAGGCGKSRLALEVAARSAAEFGDGVWLVELATRTDASLVPQAVAAALAVPAQPGRSIVDTHHGASDGQGEVAPGAGRNNRNARASLTCYSNTYTEKREVCGMALRLGDVAPDFEAETTEGRIRFHDWIGNSWAVLFSHPKDFTPVCTTELGYMAKIKPEFERRNTKIIGLSVDPVGNHAKWANDIKETQGYAPNYPMIGDTDLKVAKAYEMLPVDLEGSCEGRTPADNQTVRTVYVIGPDKKIKLTISYPMTTGRNFDEVLRVIDSLQLTAKHKVATPVNWKRGDDVIIAGSVSDDDAKKTYPKGWKAPKPYIRIVPQPE